MSQGGQEEEPMKNQKSLPHLRWDCKYHLVFISKYRLKTIGGELREKIGGTIREQRGVEFRRFFFHLFVVTQSHTPRQARIDAPGTLHHIICRGIERT
jgi:hypothetical protein